MKPSRRSEGNSGKLSPPQPGAPPDEPRARFREFQFVRQEPGLQRRWFEATDIELVVWYDQAGARTGFQLIYWPGDGERALTWRDCQGFNHSRVDSGSCSPFSNLTPILQPDGAVPWALVEELFRRRAASLEADLRDHILARLQARS